MADFCIVFAALLHTWKQAMMVLALVFCIGENSSVLPDHNNWRADGESLPITYTPAKIVLRALVSALQVEWFLSKRRASVAEIHVFHVVLRNTAINLHELYQLKQFVTKRKQYRNRGSFSSLRAKDITTSHLYFKGVKFHYLQKMAGNQLLFGLFGIGKDTERTELSHKATVKAPLEGISNQRNGRLVECARFMQKSVHAKCMAEKLRATNAMDEEVHTHEPKEKRVVESTGGKETGRIRESKEQASKSFKRQQIISGKSRFITSDPTFTGFPFLHPRVDLQILHVAIHEFASDRRNMDKKQHDMLVRALQCVAPSTNQISKLYLTEGLKISTTARCGDLDSTGVYSIRSNQMFSDDCRSRLADRTSHAVHNFVCVSERGVSNLVRLLGLIQCEQYNEPQGGKKELVEAREYCVAVVMSKMPKGYLPFDRYGYRVLQAHGVDYPDIRIFPCDSIAYPAYCVPTNPEDFRTVENLSDSSVSFYNIPMSRVLCEYQAYTDLLCLNSDHVKAFRTVAEMNVINGKLLDDVKSVHDRDKVLKERKKEQTKIKRQEAAKLKAETSRLLKKDRGIVVAEENLDSSSSGSERGKDVFEYGDEEEAVVNFL